MAAWATGDYKINALDLAKLGDTYTITMDARTVADGTPTLSDVKFVDKKTGKEVTVANILPGNDVQVSVSGADKVGTGTLTIEPTAAAKTAGNITGTYSVNFSVVSGKITKADVSLPAKTKIGNTTLSSKKALNDSEVTNAIAQVLGTDDTPVVVYNSTAIEPLKDVFSKLELTVSHTVVPETLVLGTDYDITYSNNTDSFDVSSKKSSITLTFKGKYAGEIKYEFKIKRAKVTVTDKDVEYTAGKTSYDVAAKVETVVNGKNVAVPEKDYTISTTKKATLENGSTASGVVRFENKNYIITDGIQDDNGYYYKYISSKVTKKDISKCTATVEGSYVYTGETISPKLIVKDGDVTLKEGTDYKVTSKTGANAGDATVTITGQGWYKGTLDVKYTIAKANLANATVLDTLGKKDFKLSYNGYPVVNVNTVVGSVKIGNTTLTAYDPATKTGDYVITIDDNAIEVGTYNFTIKAAPGNSRVEGEYKGTFQIVASEQSGSFAPKLNPVYSANAQTLEVGVTGAYYTGKAITPTVKLSVDGVELAQNIDYTIKSCTNNVNAGEATVTVEGKGDYSGTQTAKFTINKANLSDVKVEAKTNTVDEKEVFTYTGNQVKPTAPDFKITLNGVTLNASDFAITYPTTSKVNVNAGDASVTLVPVKTNANFTGDTKKVEFKILPRAISEIASKKGTVQLTGTFYAFDENGDRIDFSKTGYTFGYDGTEKTFKDIKFVPTVNGAKLVEGKDYEIKYFNNVTGPDAYVYVAGIGNYTNDSDQKFTGSDQTFAVKSDVFKIEGVTVGRKNITVADTEYAGGVAVTPNVTIKVGEKTLVEGTDYEFTGLSNNADVTGANKVLKATLKLKNGYKLSSSNSDEWKGVFSNPNTTYNTVDVTWKIVKKNLANTTISISETNGKLTATVLNGNVVVPSTEYDVKDNGDGTATVTAKADSKGYTGSQKVSVKKSENVGAPVISSVKVVGNKATVILSDEAEGASGYDYVISTSKDPSDKNARIDVVKNQVQTTANFKYVPQGTYYAYCHAWTRDENGKKVFGEWSNSYAFSVTAITPDTPEILSVKAKGSTITVTYKESANSTGYDVVLGKGSKKEHGETRPYQYGKYKKLNVKPGVCKAVFKNIPAGTYYAGVHSWNRTASENDNKVFSKWSNLETAKVK